MYTHTYFSIRICKKKFYDFAFSFQFEPGCQAPMYYPQSIADFDTLKVKRTRFDILLIGIRVQVLKDNLREAVALLEANGEDLLAQADKEELFQVAKLVPQKSFMQ